MAEVEEGHEHLVNYFQEFVDIYGKDYCTMNLHLHGHLKECIEDYGPVYSFWLFAFERLNGILGSYQINNQDISVQIMHTFVDSLQAYQLSLYCRESQDFAPSLKISLLFVDDS